MDRFNQAFLTALTTALLAVFVFPAGAASSNGVRVEVTVCGGSATEYRHRSTQYIEAREGCEYSIRLINDTADRVAIYLSVDGLNTIDASQTSASKASKWVLGPYQSATIPGWQTANYASRKFTFTTADASYAEWVGSTSDAGWIRAVAYREKSYTPPPVYYDPGTEQNWRRSERYDWDGGSSDSSNRKAGTGAGATAEAESSSRGRSAPPSRDYYREDDRAGTGIGREVNHSVTHVGFDAESRPFSRISIRYGYQDQLVSWGVYQPPVCSYPYPCPNCRCCNDGFAPDPYDGCYR